MNRQMAAERCRRCGGEDFIRVEKAQYFDQSDRGSGHRPLEILPGHGGEFTLWICHACGLTEWYARVTSNEVAWSVATRGGGVSLHGAQRSRLRSR